ncbi:26S proteasome subunit RPN7-domain containing protein [Nitzschia inconspicua]|uniref:26S proteasome subunit RPN7-domain containing protein n=1 Tax=Nitzschia inconspicua TaxID=303405 RepID=A0A9K3PG06_9STRA|nr:26S proteasome subunit RPN7-domain containing protein [Nitzschia inconspicua]
MDLDAYIGRYVGATRLQRLLLIAKTTPDEALAQQAFDLAETQMKEDGNVRKYKEVFGGETATAGDSTAVGSSGGERPGEQRAPPEAEAAPQLREQNPEVLPVPVATSSTDHHHFGRLRRKTPPNPKPLDLEWIAATESANKVARQVLTGRLNTAQSHLRKEAIRSAYMALAEHDLKTGNDNEAMIGYIRATDYCTTRMQTAQLSLLNLQVALCIGNFQYVRDFSRRLEATLGSSNAGGGSTSATTASNNNNINILNDVKLKLEIAKGIERMVTGKYNEAAKILIPLVMKGNSGTEKSAEDTGSSRHVLDWPGVTSPEDLALYASLMCLVTATHASNSRRQMMALADHPEALELVPEMKDLILQWSRANYVSCMQAFGGSDQSEDGPKILPMGVDLYLTPPRFAKLSQQVREMCLVEYLRPYQCVKLESMQQLFPALGPNLIDLLIDLMSRKLLPPTSRLDCRTGVLFQIPENQNPSRQIQVMEETILDDTHALLVRLACLDNDLIVHDPSAGPATRVSARSRRARGGGGGSFVPVAGDDDDSSDDDDMPGADEPDAQMMDAVAMMAMNPEDMY